jgi:DNA-binding response OmpR family regulator
MSEFDPTLSDSQLMEAASVAMDPPRVLLAEDEPEMRALLTEALEEEGYEVIPAQSGHDLLDRLAEPWLGGRDYDLVLSDVRMPGCTGLEALETLRELDWSTPVVLMTAFGSRRTHGEAQRLGASLLDKPFDLEELLERIRALVPPTRYRRGWR